MAALRNLIVALITQESGTETVEYALIFGMIAIVCFLGATVWGDKVAAQWNTVVNGFGTSEFFDRHLGE